MVVLPVLPEFVILVRYVVVLIIREFVNVVLVLLIDGGADGVVDENRR